MKRIIGYNRLEVQPESSYSLRPEHSNDLPGFERVAQLVEHVTFNHGVLGSNPSTLNKTPENSGVFSLVVRAR